MSIQILAVLLMIGCAVASFVATSGNLGDRRAPSILNIPNVRPPPSQRKFNSSVIDKLIVNITGRMKDKNLATLFQNCLPNTLDTTVVLATSNDSFVITGDIPAMWLRDSTNQVLPYVPFANEDPHLASFLHGLVLRQLRSILIDSYANSFNEVPNGNGHQNDIRKPPMQPALFEGKYELDSLCAVLKLNSHVVNSTNYNVSFLADHVSLWADAMEKILTTMVSQQLSTAEQQGNYPYMFDRNNGGGHYDIYPRKPVAHTGLIRSAFRPSDDATLLDFLIPSNAMAIVSLHQLEHLCTVMSAAYPNFAARIANVQMLSTVVREEVAAGIKLASVPSSPNSTTVVMAFELDGFGNATMMDDANVPSLLSLPFLGYNSSNYANVRSWVLSSSNPWYFNGTAGRGVGSPHTGFGMIWPMSVTMQALTSASDAEILECLSILIVSANNTGFMHESFFMDDPSIYTRHWFAWANTLFGGLIVYLAENKPHLIF